MGAAEMMIVAIMVAIIVIIAMMTPDIVTVVVPIAMCYPVIITIMVFIFVMTLRHCRPSRDRKREKDYRSHPKRLHGFLPAGHAF